MTRWRIYPVIPIDQRGARIEDGRAAHRWLVSWRVEQRGAPVHARRRKFKQKGHAQAFHNQLVAADVGGWRADARGWPVSPAESAADAGPTFDEFVDTWWADVAETFDSTRDMRAGDLRRSKAWMREEFGVIPMADVTDAHANRLLQRRRTTNERASAARLRAQTKGNTTMDDEPYTCSPRTEAMYAQTLRMLLRAAASRGLISPTVLDGIRIRKGGRVVWSSRLAFSREEVSTAATRMLDHRSGKRYACMLMLAGTAGLRPGELRAVRKDDLYLDAPTPFVRVSDSGTRTERQRLKHRAVGEWRDVPLTYPVVELLRMHLDEGYGCGDYVFSAPDGGRLDLHNFTVNYWKPVVEAYARELGKPVPGNIGLRFMRKSAITWWLDKGVDVYTAAKWAGHSPTMLLEYYASATESLNTAAVARLSSEPGDQIPLFP